LAEYAPTQQARVRRRGCVGTLQKEGTAVFAKSAVKQGGTADNNGLLFVLGISGRTADIPGAFFFLFILYLYGSICTC
jgi:hypothetical protein